MSHPYSRSRNPGRYTGSPHDEDLSFSHFSPESTSSSWRDRAEYDVEFYEIGGRYGHFSEYQTYAKQRDSGLITALFSVSSPIRHSSGAIQLVLGIREEGTQHLLIPVRHYRKLCISHSQHLPRLKFNQPYPPQEFATLSPIAFRAPVGNGDCELSMKLKSITKMGKKSHLCTTSAEARERINYERTRTLLRKLRRDTLFFDVPNPQVACFVVLFTNNTTVGPTAKDIVFGTVRADQLRDQDLLIEQITPDDIEHIRIAGRELFYANNELKDLPIGKMCSLQKDQCLPRIENYLHLLRRKFAGEIIVLVDDWNKVLEVLLPPNDVPHWRPGDPHPFASKEQSTLGRLRWQRGIAPLLDYSTNSGRKYQGLNRPMKGKDQDLYPDYGENRNSAHTLNGAMRRRSPSPVRTPDFYVVETRRMYKAVRGSGNLPEQARDGCKAFGLEIPDSGTGVDELKLIWSLWVKMAGGLSMDEARMGHWKRTVTLGIPDDDDEEAQQQEEDPVEPESLEALFNGGASAPTHQRRTHQPAVRRVVARAFLDSGSETEDDF